MKYFKVLKDTFMWNEGAIISDKEYKEHFVAIDSIFDRTEDQTEYISESIITDENNKDFFERVYPINLLSKVIYRGIEQAKEMLKKEFTE